MKVFHLQWVFLIPLQYEGDSRVSARSPAGAPNSPEQRRLHVRRAVDRVILFGVRFLKEQPGCHKTEKKAYKTT